MASAAIKRGTVWRFSLDPVAGSEERKTRPCVIVQRDSANAASPTTIVCPIRSARNERGNLLNVLVRAPEGGLARDSLVLCNEVRTLDRARVRGEMLGRLSAKTMASVDEGLRVILDLGDE